MTFVRSVATVAFAFGIVAAPALAKTRVLSDIPDAGLPATYAWAPLAGSASSTETDPRVDNSIVQSRLTRAIDQELAAKGYTRVADPSKAGMVVAFRVGVRDEQGTRVESDPFMSQYPFGYRGCMFRACFGGGFMWGAWGPPDVTVTSYDYTSGRLIVDLSSGSPATLLWRATTDKTVNSKAGTEKEIGELVHATLKKLPGPGVAD